MPAQACMLRSQDLDGRLRCPLRPKPVRTRYNPIFMNTFRSQTVLCLQVLACIIVQAVKIIFIRCKTVFNDGHVFGEMLLIFASI